MKKLFVALLFALASSLAFGSSNSSPGLYYGQVPTAGQWNSYFATKLDYIPGTVNTIPYWDGSGNLLNAVISGDCTATANVFTCPLTSSAATLFASPPPIGSTAANAGYFTSISMNGGIIGPNSLDFPYEIDPPTGLLCDLRIMNNENNAETFCQKGTTLTFSSGLNATSIGAGSLGTGQFTFLGLGSGLSTASAINLNSNNLVGVTQEGASINQTCSSSATGNCIGVLSQGSTAAASFTNTSFAAFQANDAVKGAGSTITNSYGFYANDRTTGTNNYGFFSSMSTGGGKYAFYDGGGAPSYFAGGVTVASALNLNGKVLFNATAPTIASGFGTSPSVVSSNGTATFKINVGTGGAASSGIVTMPTATTGWNCVVTPAAAPQAAAEMFSVATSVTSITITNYTASTGVALAWPASTIIAVNCVGF